MIQLITYSQNQAIMTFHPFQPSTFYMIQQSGLADLTFVYDNHMMSVSACHKRSGSHNNGISASVHDNMMLFPFPISRHMSINLILSTTNTKVIKYFYIYSYESSYSHRIRLYIYMSKGS